MFKWLLHKLKSFTPPSPLTIEEIKKRRPNPATIEILRRMPSPTPAPPPKEPQKVIIHVYHHKVN